MKLIAIPGTSSDNSTNRTLIQFIQKHFSDQADIQILEIKDWPMFRKTKTTNYQTKSKKQLI